MMVRCNQAGKDDHPSLFQDQVMVSLVEFNPTNFLYVDLTAGNAVSRRRARETDDAVGNTFDLQVLNAGSTVIEHQHRALATGKKLLQLQNLSAVAQRRLGEHPHFRE